MSVTIKWNHTPQQIAGRIFDDATMIKVHTLLKEYCADYVPMDSGNLAQSGIPKPDCLEYPGPYAHYQWMGEVYGPNIPIYEDGVFAGFVSPPDKHPTGRKLEYSKDKNPAATSHWEKAMMVAKGDRFCESIENYLKSKRK